MITQIFIELNITNQYTVAALKLILGIVRPCNSKAFNKNNTETVIFLRSRAGWFFARDNNLCEQP